MWLFFFICRFRTSFHVYDRYFPYFLDCSISCLCSLWQSSISLFPASTFFSLPLFRLPRGIQLKICLGNLWVYHIKCFCCTTTIFVPFIPIRCLTSSFVVLSLRKTLIARLVPLISVAPIFSQVFTFHSRIDSNIF